MTIRLRQAQDRILLPETIVFTLHAPYGADQGLVLALETLELGAELGTESLAFPPGTLAFLGDSVAAITAFLEEVPPRLGEVLNEKLDVRNPKTRDFHLRW